MTMPDAEEIVTSQLRELAEADARLAPPASVEQAVMAQWDRAPQTRWTFGEWRTGRWLLGVAAVAALLIAGAAIARRFPVSTPASQTGLETAASVGTLPQTHTAPDSRAALSETGPEPARQRSRRSAPSRRPPSDLDDASAAEEVAVFVPLGPLTEQERDDAMQVVRVRLSRSALVGLGVPVDETHAAELLQADVLLGEDGFARGIRFVRH